MKRGMSSIVAVVFLIAIAIIAGISVYFWMAGLTTKQPEPVKPTPIVANPIGNGKVLIANLGNKPINASTIDVSDGNISCPNVEVGPGEQVLCEISGEGTIAIYGSQTGATIIQVPKSNSPPSVDAIWDNTGGKTENGNTVTFYANISDPDGNIDKVILYTNITGSWSSYEMSLQSGNTYYYQETASVDGTVYYYVLANDTEGESTTSENKSFLVYTPGATVQWYKTYDWANDDQARAVFVDSTGIYMTGFETVNYWDIKTAKTDLSGNLIWNASVGGSNSYYDVGDGILVYNNTAYIAAQYWIDSDHWHDNVILRYTSEGSYEGYTSSDYLGGGYDRGIDIVTVGGYIYSLGYGDAGTKALNLLKIAPNGTKIFFKWVYDSSADDRCGGITTDGTYLYFVGSATSTTVDSILGKTDQDGNLIWGSNIDLGAGQNDAAKKILYLDGYLYITGQYYDSTAGYYKFYFAKYDSNGNQIYLRKYDIGDVRTAGEGLVTDGTYIYAVTATNANGDYDGVLLKLDPASGDVLWNETFDLEGNEYFHRVYYYNGLLYTVGYTDVAGEQDWLLVVWKENGT